MRALLCVAVVAGWLGWFDVTEAADLERLPAEGGAPWSAAVRSGRFVHVSAIAPVGADGKALASGIGPQTRVVLDSMQRVLKAAGTDLARAASVHVYLRRASDFTAMNEVYATFWTADPPVRTTIGQQVEIMVNATR